MCKCCNNTTSPKARGGVVFRCSYPEVLCRKKFAIFTRKSTMTFIFNKVGLQLYKLTKRGSVQNFSKQLQFRRTPLNDGLLLTLREKCPNTRGEYGDLRSKSSYSARLRENTDKKKLRIWILFTQCEYLSLDNPTDN